MKLSSKYRHSRLTWVIFLLFVMTLAPMTAPEVQAEASGTIRLYTSIPQQIIDSIRDEFVRRNPKVQLEIFRAGATGVQSQIELELGSPDGLAADLVWQSDPVYLIDLKERNVLDQYKSPEDANLLIGKDPEGYYYGGRLMTVIIVYSTDRVFGDNIPASWQDLLDPKFQGKIAIPDPLISGTALDALAALKDKFGWEYYRGLFENGVSIASSNGRVNDAILEGRADVGVTLDYMVRERRGMGEPLQLVYPNDGFVVVESPIAITRTSTNKEAAKVFMDFVLSQEGQQTMVKVGNFLPVRSDVYPPENAPTIDRVLEEQIPITWENLRTNIIRIKGRYFDIMKEFYYYQEPEGF